MVLAQTTGGPLQVLLNAEELAQVSKDHSAFLSLLTERAKEAHIPLKEE